MAVLLTTVISIMAVSVTGYLCIHWNRAATEETLTEHLELNLMRVMREKAHSIDAKLEHYECYIQLAVDSLEDMFLHREQLVARGTGIEPPANTRDFALTRSLASQDLSAKDLGDDIKFYSNLETLWRPIVRENSKLITTMYLGTVDGLMVSYDRYSYLSYAGAGKELIYNYKVSEWYKKGMAEDGIFHTDTYMDSQGRGLTVTIGSSYRDQKGEPAGVVCLDFDLSALYEELFSANLNNSTFTFVLDQQGNIISNDADTLDLEDYTGLTLDGLDTLMDDADGIMEKGDLIYVRVPMERLGWTLCARVQKDAIQRSIHDADDKIAQAFGVFVGVVGLILVAAVFAVRVSVRAITKPMEQLRRDIKTIADGDLSYRATVLRNDEIGDITSGMNEMVDRLNFTLNELMSSQEHADAMSRLATLDTLTGIRNKTAFDSQSKVIAEELAAGPCEFGYALVDLNNLKVINDNYGHDKGDIAIKRLSRIICDVFGDSLVFRVGGDEFVVLLKDETYANAESLVRRFRNTIRVVSTDWRKEPWEQVSAAIGYALYDEELDGGSESVLVRADKEMYASKRAMKAAL